MAAAVAAVAAAQCRPRQGEELKGVCVWRANRIQSLAVAIGPSNKSNEKKMHF